MIDRSLAFKLSKRDLPPFEVLVVSSLATQIAKSVKLPRENVLAKPLAFGGISCSPFALHIKQRKFRSTHARSISDQVIIGHEISMSNVIK